MRRIEKEAEKMALKSSTNNEPIWVGGFIAGAEYVGKLISKDIQGYADKAAKVLKNEDPEKHFTEQEKKDLICKIEIGRTLSSKVLKVIEEEAEV